MPLLTSLSIRLIQEIKDLYNAENQLVQALPKMADAANDPLLREAFFTHFEETKIHSLQPMIPNEFQFHAT